MTTEDVLRLNFYERQFLRTADFQDEQAYHIEMRRRHNIAHHTWGTVAGLEITQDPTSKVWAVQPGFAVDRYGREIILFDPEPLDTKRIADRLAGMPLPAELKVWIAYHTEKSNPPKPGFEVCGQDGQYTRLRETFRLIYRDDPPGYDKPDFAPPYAELNDDPGSSPAPLLLGTITWDQDPLDPAKKTIVSVDAEKRRYVGLRASELTASTVAQNTPAAAPFKDALTIRADEITATGMVSGEQTRLVVDGNLQVNGNVDFRTTSGSEAGASLTASRSNKDLRFKIGASAGDGARLVVGAGADEKLVINATGDAELDGRMTIKGKKELFLNGGRIAIRKEDATEIPLMDMSRKDTDLRLGIGSAADFARLVVGPKQGDNVAEKFVVANDGRVTIDGTLKVTGNIDTDARVNGRDIRADGTKLDGLSAGATEIKFFPLLLSDGSVIPKPPGFTTYQFFVSPAFSMLSINPFIKNVSMQCFVSGPNVTMKWILTDVVGNSTTQSGLANVLVICIK